MKEFTNKLEMKYFTMENHSVILFSLCKLKVKLTRITVVTWKGKKNECLSTDLRHRKSSEHM